MRGSVHDIGGRPLWVESHRATDADGDRRAPLVFLHGGLSDSRVFGPLLARLGTRHAVWAYDRRGHGRTPDTDEPFSFASMLAEATALIEWIGDGPVHLVGHSDGANLALLLAVHRPRLVASVSAFSGNLDPSGYEEGTVTVEQLVDAVGPAYAAVSPDGAEHLPVVAAKTLRLWTTEPRITPGELSAVRVPVLVGAGEHDVVRREHTQLIADSLPGARLAVLQGATHMVVEDAPAECAALVTETVDRAARTVSGRAADGGSAHSPRDEP